MEMSSFEIEYNKDRTSTSLEQLEEEVVEKTSIESATMDRVNVDFIERGNDLQVQNTRLPNQKYNRAKRSRSAPCKCRSTIVKPFKCGLCLKAYSTICKLHEHLEYVHRDSEMYLFDKVTQTAYPRCESSSAATQTDAEQVHRESSSAGRPEDEFLDPELEVTFSYGDSTKELDEIEHSNWNGTEHGINTESNYGRSSADVSEVFNSHEGVLVKAEVLSADDAQKSQGEKRKKLNSKKKKKHGPFPFKKTNGKSKVKKIIINDLNTRTSKTLVIDDEGCLQVLRCCHCFLEFSSNYFLQLHVKEEHSEEMQRAISNTQCSSTNDLMRHLADHKGPESRTCDKCNKIYCSESKLKRHIKEHHSNVKDFMCQHCGEGFATGSLLYSHRKKCLDIRPFACQYENCDKKYRKRNDLKAHMSSHTGELPFICDVCGKGFARLNVLKKHAFVHSGERPMKCDQCLKAFSTRDRLLRHMMTHSQDKPLQCYCGKAFSNNWNLKAHARQHTGEKPYTCDICGAEFTHNVSRKNHMKVHTGDA